MNWSDRLAIVSDEAAAGFSDAVAVALPLGIRAYELRHLSGKRVPYVGATVLNEVERLVTQHDLKIVGLSPGFCKSHLEDPGSADELQYGMQKTLELIKRFGIPALTTFTYKRDPTLPNATPPESVITNLAKVAAACNAAGVELRLENSAGSWGDTGEHLAWIAEKIEVPVTWDPANSQAAGQPGYPDGYHHIRDRISLVHCKDWLPDKGNVDIGEGQTDMAGQIKALIDDGYQGYFTVEPHQWDDRAGATQRNTRRLLELCRRCGDG